jgi:hypothetical protein
MLFIDLQLHHKKDIYDEMEPPPAGAGRLLVAGFNAHRPSVPRRTAVFAMDTLEKFSSQQYHRTGMNHQSARSEV